MRFIGFTVHIKISWLVMGSTILSVYMMSYLAVEELWHVWEQWPCWYDERYLSLGWRQHICNGKVALQGGGEDLKDIWEHIRQGGSSEKCYQVASAIKLHQANWRIQLLSSLIHPSSHPQLYGRAHLNCWSSCWGKKIIPQPSTLFGKWADSGHHCLVSVCFHYNIKCFFMASTQHNVK